MTQGLVSIIMPTYNGRSEWLSQAIDSVISQTYVHRELIIINDASTNDIEKTILEYRIKDKRIKYIKNDKNLKQAASRNKAIKESKGRYIAFIDDDDLRCNTNKLKKQINFLENNPNYGLCGTSVIVIDEYGQEIEKIQQRETNQDIKQNLLKGNQFACSSVMVRKNDNYLFDINFGGLAEDYELWCRIGRNSKLYNIQDYYLQYRINLGGASQTNKRKMILASFKVFRKNRKYYPNKLSNYIYRIISMCFPKSIKEAIKKIMNKDKYF